MARELMQETVEVIGSPFTWIIGKIIQNPGDTEMYIISAAKLRFHTVYNNNNLRMNRTGEGITIADQWPYPLMVNG